MTFADRIDTIFEVMERGRDLLDTVVKLFPSVIPHLAKFDITLSNLRKIGAGCQGVAYSDGHKVVKVTEDEKEAKASQRVKERGPIIGINNIINVAKLDGTFNFNDMDLDDWESQFYVIIQDLQGTDLSELENEVADFVGDFIQKHYHDESSKAHRSGKGLIAIMNSRSASEASVKALAVEITKHVQNHKHSTLHFSFKDVFGSSSQALTITTQILEAIIRLHYYADVRFFDVQGGNLGKDSDGNYVIFDLGVSKTRGDCSLDLLSAGFVCNIPVIY